jgi:hypothetical protein
MDEFPELEYFILLRAAGTGPLAVNQEMQKDACLNPKPRL